jgi:hypothetical protein
MVFSFVGSELAPSFRFSGLVCCFRRLRRAQSLRCRAQGRLMASSWSERSGKPAVSGRRPVLLDERRPAGVPGRLAHPDRFEFVHLRLKLDRRSMHRVSLRQRTQRQGDRVGAQAVELVDDVLADQVIDLGLLGVVVVGLAAFAELQKTSDEAVHDRVLAPSLCDGIWSRHGIMSKTDCLRLG